MSFFGYDHGEDHLIDKESKHDYLYLLIVIGLILFLTFIVFKPIKAYALDGYATYYTAKSCAKEAKDLNLEGNYWGVKTANGERFNEGAMTCALRRRDFGKDYLVYAHDTGKSIVVRHNDFGPGQISYYQHDNVIDLTPAGIKALGIKGRGRVSIQEIK